jgi:hypothetical protein
MDKKLNENEKNEKEVMRRIEREQPSARLAHLSAVHLKARWRWTGDKWMGFNALSGRFSEASGFTVGAMLGAFVATTARAALGGSSDEMDAALKQPDWPAIEQAVRVLLSADSRFLTAPIEAPVQVQPQGQRRGLQRVPSAPAGARRGTSSVAVR